MHSNALTLTYSFYDGGLFFNGAAPITDATGRYSVPVLTCYHAFSFLGRSANVNASLPYAVGTFQGKVIGQDKQLYRSGLADSTFRISVNLKGGPAMQPQQFAKWKQKTLLGVSLKIVAPTGQYDQTKLINWGAIAGHSSRNSGIPDAGTNGYSMAMLVSGSIPQILSTFRNRTPNLNPRSP
jgi:hypothetical protein